MEERVCSEAFREVGFFSHYYTLYTEGVEMAPDKKELGGRIKRRTLCK